jgi:hypothetical protein
MNKFFFKKGAIEISFGWLFAIIAGAIILFLAIFLGSKIIGSSDETISAETGKEITILLNPLETSFESAQKTSITIPAETKITNFCSNETPFGKQTLQLDQKRFNKWSETDIKISSYNKYIFSKEEVTGKKFYLFSKPFDFPFKIANLIYLTSADDIYCFKDAPSEIEKEILNLNQSNMLIENCPDESIKICFSGNGCDIEVDYSEGVVKKEGEIFYFTGIENSDALMYAAIFSDKEVYKCQIRRIMLRLKELANLYNNKQKILQETGCDDDIGVDLIELEELANKVRESLDLFSVKEKADEIEIMNKRLECLLW